MFAHLSDILNDSSALAKLLGKAVSEESIGSVGLKSNDALMKGDDCLANKLAQDVFTDDESRNQGTCKEIGIFGENDANAEQTSGKRLDEDASRRSFGEVGLVGVEIGFHPDNTDHIAVEKMLRGRIRG